MNILEKLGVMVEINSRNEARIAQFIETEKTLKRWKVDYAVMYKTGEVEEDCFIGKAPTLSEMLQDAQKMLDSVAPTMGCVKWINNKLKVPILAACRQLDGSENRSAWAQVMRESNIRVICGYHATAPGSADVSVANSFFSYINGGSTGNSVKYSWHHANSSHGNNSTYMVLVYQNDNQCYYRLPGFSSVTYRDPNRTTDSIYAYASFMEGGVRAKNAGTAQQSNEQLPYELKLSKTVRVALPIKDGREASCTIVDPDTGALFLGYGEFPFEQVDVKKAEEQNYKCFEELFGRLLLDEALIKNCKTEMFEVLPDSKEGEHTTLAIASQFVNQYHGITIGDNLIVITTDANGINSISNRWRDVAPVEDTVMLECKRELTPELKKLVEKKIRELGFETEISSCDLIYLENGEKCVLYHEVDLANGERLYVDALTHAITF